MSIDVGILLFIIAFSFFMAGYHFGCAMYEYAPRKNKFTLPRDSKQRIAAMKALMRGETVEFLQDGVRHRLTPDHR